MPRWRVIRGRKCVTQNARSIIERSVSLGRLLAVARKSARIAFAHVPATEDYSTSEWSSPSPGLADFLSVKQPARLNQVE